MQPKCSPLRGRCHRKGQQPPLSRLQRQPRPVWPSLHSKWQSCAAYSLPVTLVMALRPKAELPVSDTCLPTSAYFLLIKPAGYQEQLKQERRRIDEALGSLPKVACLEKSLEQIKARATREIQMAEDRAKVQTEIFVVLDASEFHRPGARTVPGTV